MGSGKTTVGNILFKKLKHTAMPVVDRVKWFVSDFKRNIEGNKIAASVVRKMAEEYLNQGVNLLIPQAFWKKENIDHYLKIGKKKGAKVFVYHLTAPKDILFERVAGREKPKEAKTPISLTRVKRNYKMWKDNRYELGKSFDTSVVSADKIAREILKDVKSEKL